MIGACTTFWTIFIWTVIRIMSNTKPSYEAFKLSGMWRFCTPLHQGWLPAIQRWGGLSVLVVSHFIGRKGFFSANINCSSRYAFSGMVCRDFKMLRNIIHSFKSQFLLIFRYFSLISPSYLPNLLLFSLFSLIYGVCHEYVTIRDRRKWLWVRPATMAHNYVRPGRFRSFWNAQLKFKWVL